MSFCISLRSSQVGLLLENCFGLVGKDLPTHHGHDVPPGTVLAHLRRVSPLLSSFFLGWQTWGECPVLQGSQVGSRLPAEAQLHPPCFVPIVKLLT